MPRRLHTAFLVLLAAVFTIGLTFATVELPYLIDEVLQNNITTPGLDSHADEMSRLKTELFISHFHLRLIGYACFALLVLAIIVGFATRKTGLAAIGAVGFMLPVFAQFAGVMFFLAGLGLLNVVWLPVLDISFELQRLGLIIRAPYDLLMWLFRQVGISGYWPIVYFFLGSGLLLFFFGTFAWLSARARKQDVADFWVYRISRHPQYLGWILWSYGVYLLLLRGVYPKRSWGIDASLPWLVSTLVIIGVAMLEELNMRKRFGDAYETYRRSAPFLFPLPGFVEKVFALPTRLLFKKSQPDRRREVAVVI
ncbi:MAG: methyltransferase family protein, partial [Planctomycetota bacterium]